MAEITLHCPLCGKPVSGKTEKGAVSKLRRHTASIACRRRVTGQPQPEPDANLFPTRFVISRRNNKYAVVCTDLDPASAAMFMDSVTPGEAWALSQAARPLECEDYGGCWHVPLTKVGKAFVN
jgi:hypothetical protein